MLDMLSDMADLFGSEVFVDEITGEKMLDVKFNKRGMTKDAKEALEGLISMKAFESSSLDCVIVWFVTKDHANTCAANVCLYIHDDTVEVEVHHDMIGLEPNIKPVMGKIIAMDKILTPLHMWSAYEKLRNHDPNLQQDLF